jgi:hypothetical protein
MSTPHADAVQTLCYGPRLKGGEAHKPTIFTIEAHNKLGGRIQIVMMES